MHFIARVGTLIGVVMLTSCIHKGTHPDDPYEALNRQVFKFNQAFDATFLKPPARLYQAIIPAPVRASVNNFYNNIYMIPTIANDLLQGQVKYALADGERLVINTVVGMGGIFDVATRHHLPMRQTDLGVTFAKWGDTHSPFVMLPFLGPSTIRDGMGLLFEYPLLTPYPYIKSDALLYGLIGLRYIDLRAQFFEAERLTDEALDKYSFIRDAYLQHRNYLIHGEKATTATPEADDLYIDDESSPGVGDDYIEEDGADTLDAKVGADYVDEVTSTKAPSLNRSSS